MTGTNYMRSLSRLRREEAATARSCKTFRTQAGGARQRRYCAKRRQLVSSATKDIFMASDSESTPDVAAELAFSRHPHTNVYLHKGRVQDAYIGDVGAIASFQRSMAKMRGATPRSRLSSLTSPSRATALVRAVQTLIIVAEPGWQSLSARNSPPLLRRSSAGRLRIGGKPQVRALAPRQLS